MVFNHLKTIEYITTLHPRLSRTKNSKKLSNIGFSGDVLGKLIRAQALEDGLAQQAVIRPFGEGDFTNELGLYPSDGGVGMGWGLKRACLARELDHAAVDGF